MDHYRWLYRKDFFEEGYQIGPIVRKNGLFPKARDKKPAVAPVPNS